MKHRGNVFAVVRTELGGGSPVIIGVYSSLNRAEEIAGKSEQAFIDTGFAHDFTFEVQPSIYYDE